MCNYSNKPVPLKKEVMPLPPKFDISENTWTLPHQKTCVPKLSSHISEVSLHYKTRVLCLSSLKTII